MELLSVVRFEEVINDLLRHAETVKQSHSVEPALAAGDFGDKLDQIGSDSRQYAAIEAACRKIFQSVVVTTSIKEPEFVTTWNLLDLMLLLGDNEQCEPALSVWLIEELLESQTIDGCRTVFDYFESRRERISRKHFERRKLVVLRSCNELLRRLSRAEDTVFCGRVFIFLFQYFPLGDKSSVNLRGEYHVENSTVFDKEVYTAEEAVEKMDVDTDGETAQQTRSSTPKAASKDTVNESNSVKGAGVTTKSTSLARSRIPKPTLSLDTLYPIFWSLQGSFSDPTKLFDPGNFKSFKYGISVTIDKFREVAKQKGNTTSKLSDDGGRGLKRKRENGKTDSASGFNPKYLTSHDLFELEISDLAFRRYMLVQVLILIDFLLSLTPTSKAKAENLTTPNKSVLYSYILSEEDAAWAVQTKAAIILFLREPQDGPFYHRMVETVLSRDRNWVRWKAETCPSMARPAVSSEEWQQAANMAKQICQNKKLRRIPMNAIDVSFLDDPDANSLAALKDPKRYEVPKVEDFRGPIADDDFEIDMPTNDESKEQAISSKQSKTWRALRLAAQDRFKLLEKVEGDASDIRPLFESASEEQPKASEDMETDGNHTQDDTKENGNVDGKTGNAPTISVAPAAESATREHTDVLMQETAPEPITTVDGT